jgi:hypothetical protein
MKKLITLTITYLLCLLWVNSLAQKYNDKTIIDSYAIVSEGESDIINQYFEGVRIETALPIITYASLKEYPAEKAEILRNGIVEKDKVYIVNNEKYLCQETYNEVDASQTKDEDKFVKSRESNDILEWVEKEEVVIGTIRTFEKIDYECLKTHVTTLELTPPKTPELWGNVKKESKTKMN